MNEAEFRITDGRNYPECGRIWRLTPIHTRLKTQKPMLLPLSKETLVAVLWVCIEAKTQITGQTQIRLPGQTLA